MVDKLWQADLLSEVNVSSQCKYIQYQTKALKNNLIAKSQKFQRNQKSKFQVRHLEQRYTSEWNSQKCFRWAKDSLLIKLQRSQEELIQKLQYKGAIIGDHSRLFFSIPTARRNSQEYYNFHYLLDTGSPYTTLTHQALCCLYGKKVDDYNVLFSSLLKTSIGGYQVWNYLSNPHPTEKNPTHNYHNVNLLGMNFLRQFIGYKLEGNFREKLALLELIEL